MVLLGRVVTIDRLIDRSINRSVCVLCIGLIDHTRSHTLSHTHPGGGQLRGRGPAQDRGARREHAPHDARGPPGACCMHGCMALLARVPSLQLVGGGVGKRAVLCPA